MLFFRKRYINKIKSVIKSDNALILVGARQVGKSSLLAIMKDKGIVDNNIMLSGDELVLEDFNPESFLDYLKLKYNIVNKDFLIIDEAQKIKNIGLIIKYLVDQKKEGKINFKAIISGSGSLEIFRGITDSLIGRYNLIKVTPFSFEEFLEFNDVNISSIDLKNITKPVLNEIKKYYDLYIKYGGYPEVVKANTENDKKKKFKNIYNDYLYKDISFLLKGEDIINFEKFLKLFVSKIGSLIKIEQLMHELGIKKSQCEKYIKILKSSFLFDFIKPFGEKGGNEIKKANKGYFIDVGFLNYILGVTTHIGDFKGKIVENFVYNEILFSKKEFLDICFWQNRNGTEVDFVLIDNFDKTIYPIEVKSGIRDIIPRSLLSFVSKYEKNIIKLIITSENISKIRKTDNKTFIFVPYYLIGYYLGNE